MEKGIKFLHLNIEGKKHIDPICEFLETHEIEVFCSQETNEDTASMIAEKFGFEYKFAPLWTTNPGETPSGIAIFSKYPITASSNTVLLTAPESYKSGNDTFNVLIASIEKGGEVYNFATVHLPVNYPGSSITDFQMEVYERLKEELAKMPSFLLTGDFNSPRGTAVFDGLAQSYKDNVPENIDSTIDPVLHRSPELRLVVDGVFTTDDYKISDIHVSEGLSDHKAITGTLEISKN